MGVSVWFGTRRAGSSCCWSPACSRSSALSLVPRSQRWFTPLGAASLVVYLCHGFFVKGGAVRRRRRLVRTDEVTAFVLVTGAAVLLALALAATPVPGG